MNSTNVFRNFFSYGIPFTHTWKEQNAANFTHLDRFNISVLPLPNNGLNFSMTGCLQVGGGGEGLHKKNVGKMSRVTDVFFHNMGRTKGLEK